MNESTKNNEKQIEEMAKDLKDLAGIVRNVLVDRTDIGYIPDLAFPIAKEVLKHYQPKLLKDSVVLPKSEYNDLVESKRQLGCYIEDQAILLQGNIPQGCVVLSREEYDCLKKIEKAYDPFWFCSFGGCEGVSKECKDTCEMSIFVKERKETAEKILERGKYCMPSGLRDWIIEQFGVEINNSNSFNIDEFNKGYAQGIKDLKNSKRC